VESQPIQDTVQRECSGTNFGGNFEEFSGYPRTSGGIPYRSRVGVRWAFGEPPRPGAAGDFRVAFGATVGPTGLGPVGDLDDAAFVGLAGRHVLEDRGRALDERDVLLFSSRGFCYGATRPAAVELRALLSFGPSRGVVISVDAGMTAVEFRVGPRSQVFKTRRTFTKEALAAGLVPIVGVPTRHHDGDPPPFVTVVPRPSPGQGGEA